MRNWYKPPQHFYGRSQYVYVIKPVYIELILRSGRNYLQSLQKPHYVTR